MKRSTVVAQGLKQPTANAGSWETPLYDTSAKSAVMYSARTRVENEQWIEEIAATAEELDLDADAQSTATDLFLSSVPETERSKRAVMAASIYAATLITSQARSQSAVADAAGVARLTIQQRWKDLLREAGMEPPGW